MDIRPLHDRVLIKRLDEEGKTKGGIIIPDSAKEKPLQGEVMAVGTGRITKEGTVTALAVLKGDKVLFSKYAGTEITVEGNEYLMMREDDLLAIVKH